MNKILLSIMKKEFWHILRDPQTLTIIILMPIIMLFLFGYAITLEMQEIETAIVDQSRSPQSRDLIERIISTDFFKVVETDVAYNEMEALFFKRLVRCIVIIPAPFAHDLERDMESPVQLIIDASDPNAANYINNYFMKINSSFNLETLNTNLIPMTLEPQLLYNPDLKSSYFFVPGLIAIILLLICALLTSIAIVREKEVGTMEQILVSPIHPSQIIIGKVIPYTILGFIDSLIILFIANNWFDIPIHGSFLFLCCTLILYIITGLSFGLFLSTIAESQRTAMMAVLVSTILPTIMLSGFIFPVPSMPVLFQYISKIIPATHFLEIIRGIMLKGIGINELFTQVIYLCAISTFLVIVSLKKFKTNLE
jgi:ABC-2 type transport system permease protein